MPWLLGKDLRHLPIEERKGLLAEAVPDGGAVRVVPSLPGDPGELFDAACQQGWEGLVAKRAGSLYRPGRSPDWRKLKCECRQEMVIGGFTEPQGTRDSFGALLLGYWEGDDLGLRRQGGYRVHPGHLARTLPGHGGAATSASPFSASVAERGARWVQPELVVEVAFSNWTRDGRLRHPRLCRLRRTSPAGREPGGMWFPANGR